MFSWESFVTLSLISEWLYSRLEKFPVSQNRSQLTNGLSADYSSDCRSFSFTRKKQYKWLINNCYLLWVTWVVRHEIPLNQHEFKSKSSSLDEFRWSCSLKAHRFRLLARNWQLKSNCFVIYDNRVWLRVLQILSTSLLEELVTLDLLTDQDLFFFSDFKFNQPFIFQVALEDNSLISHLS